MAMTATVLALGAAGDKAAIGLIEKGIVHRDHVKLLNTTSKDIPDEYKDPSLFTSFSPTGEGCGKESSKGRSYMIEAITNGQIDLSSMMNDDSREVILVSSVEGGSGAGSTPVVAKYFDAMNVPVHVFAFIGFQDEARGINNTLKFFKDLPEKTVLHTIVNSYFLDYTKNYSKAESLANDEFCREVEILLGTKLYPTKHNIDDRDLYKINTQEGYMTINHIPLANVKNTEAFNKLIAESFENACYLDCDQSAKRIAVMINASRRIQEVIDNSFEVVKRYVGTPIELFQHIQPDDDSDVEEDYIDIIACGLNFPEKAFKEVSAKYNRLKEKLSTSRKSLGDIFGEIPMDDEMDEFNMDVRHKVDKAKADDLFSQQIGMYPIRVAPASPAKSTPKPVEKKESSKVEAPKLQKETMKTPSEETKGVPPSKDNPHAGTQTQKIEYGLREITREQDEMMDVAQEVQDVAGEIEDALNSASIRNPMQR